MREHRNRPKIDSVGRAPLLFWVNLGWPIG